MAACCQLSKRTKELVRNSKITVKIYLKIVNKINLLVHSSKDKKDTLMMIMMMIKI